jgi:hypothetical protein
VEDREGDEGKGPTVNVEPEEYIVGVDEDCRCSIVQTMTAGECYADQQW